MSEKNLMEEKGGAQEAIIWVNIDNKELRKRGKQAGRKVRECLMVLVQKDQDWGRWKSWGKEKRGSKKC